MPTLGTFIYAAVSMLWIMYILYIIIICLWSIWSFVLKLSGLGDYLTSCAYTGNNYLYSCINAVNSVNYLYTFRSDEVPLIENNARRLLSQIFTTWIDNPKLSFLYKSTKLNLLSSPGARSIWYHKWSSEKMSVLIGSLGS